MVFVMKIKEKWLMHKILTKDRLYKAVSLDGCFFLTTRPLSLALIKMAFVNQIYYLYGSRHVATYGGDCCSSTCRVH